MKQKNVRLLEPGHDEKCVNDGVGSHQSSSCHREILVVYHNSRNQLKLKSCIETPRLTIYQRRRQLHTSTDEEHEKLDGDNPPGVTPNNLNNA
jgi:hypothetical protein